MKKMLAFILTVLLIPVIPVSADEGLNFKVFTLYKTENAVETVPATYELTVEFPQDYTDEGGVAMGNYDGEDGTFFTIQILENGVPYLAYRSGNTTTHGKTFSDVNVYTGKPVHMAFVLDSTNKYVYLYIDSVLAQSIYGWCPKPTAAMNEYVALGGDLRANNSKYFKGKIYSAGLYSDMRTADEIAADFSSSTPDTDNLIAAYSLSESSDPLVPYAPVIEDLSPNKNDMHIVQNSTWLIDPLELEPYEYSFAVVGDTQVINNGYPQSFSGIYDWILDNVENFNTKFILGLGDITNNNTDREYALADAVFHRLKGVVPFSFIRGNHDKTAMYNKYFTVEKYGDQISGCYDGKMENTYHKFDVGNIKYMAVNIDCGAADDMLEWANEVVAANPDRNVIVTTHGYINGEGELLDSSEASGPNDGQALWDKFIRKHKNIVLVICGHIPNKEIVMSTQVGDNGNTVTQLLIDAQDVDSSVEGGIGTVAMLHFSKDGKNVQVRYYSTIQKAYYMGANQFSFTMETVADSAGVPEAVIKESSLSLSVPEGDEANGEITLNKDVLTYIADTTEASSLSLNVKTDNFTNGKLIAALYDNRTRLRSIKIYDPAQLVNVEFDEVYSGDKVKVHWWDSENSLMPIGNDR